MSETGHDRVNSALEQLREAADRRARGLPAVDVDAIIRRAEEPIEIEPRRLRTLWPRVATAAALLVVVAGALLLVFSPQPPAPQEMLELVNRLYDDDDFVADTLVAALQPEPSGYMSDVWGNVAQGLAEP